MSASCFFTSPLVINHSGKAAIAVFCLLSGLPCFAQVTVHDSFMMIEDPDNWIFLTPTSLEINDYSAGPGAGLEVQLSDGSIWLTRYSPYSSMTVKPTGLNFPDLTEQTSAAYTKSETDALLAAVQPVVAWPMVCKADAATGVVPIYPNPPATLFCRSPQSGVPGGDIGSAAGVPTGYFFVVTDVLATCGIGANCDGVFFWLSRRNIVDGDTELETWDFPLSNTTTAGDKLLSLQFAGPLMILEEGDYLVGFGSLTTSGEGHTVFAQVMGYLTANPERFGR